jgi:hypothetical protein
MDGNLTAPEPKEAASSESAAPRFDSRASAFPKRAARLSVWVFPFGGLSILVLSGALIREQGYGRAQKMLIATSSSCAVWIIGILFGVMALWGITRLGRKGLFWRGWVGILANGFLVAAGISVMFFGIAAQKEIRRLADNEAERMSRRLRSGETLPEALAAYADQCFSTRLIAARGDYQKAADVVSNPFLLSMRPLTNKGELAVHQERINDYIAASERFRDFLDRAALIYREELFNHALTKEQRTKMQKDFEASFGRTKKTILALRAADIQRGHIMQSAVNLLEIHWGKWAVQTGKPIVQFEQPRLNKRYEQLLAEYRATTLEELRLLQLLKVNKAPNE